MGYRTAPQTVDEQVEDIYERLRRLWKLLARQRRDLLEVCGTVCIGGAADPDVASNLVVSKVYIEVAIT